MLNSLANNSACLTKANLNSARTGRASRFRRLAPRALQESAGNIASSMLVASADTFSQQVVRLLEQPSPHYVVFSADLDPATGLPWCPDCVRSMPAIMEAVKQRGGSLLEVRVGPRPEWKDQQHPFRLDPQLRLTGIPTLMHWSREGPAQRIMAELENAATPDEAAQVVAEFIKKTAP